MNVLAIDPGKWVCGWAHFVRDELCYCGVGESRAKELCRRLLEMNLPHTPASTIVTIESMEWHPGRENSSPNDLLAVQAVAAGLFGRYLDSHLTELVSASRWKGRVPKNVHHTRIREKLTPAECDVLDDRLVGVRKANHKEVMDAVGLGLWRVGR